MPELPEVESVRRGCEERTRRAGVKRVQGAGQEVNAARKSSHEEDT